MGRHIKDFNERINEDNKWDPFKALTYFVEININFERFEEPVDLKFKIVVPHYEEKNEETLKKYTDDYLKIAFKDVVFSYKINNIEEAKGTDRILPMH